MDRADGPGTPLSDQRRGGGASGESSQDIKHDRLRQQPAVLKNHTSPSDEEGSVLEDHDTDQPTESNAP